MFRFGRVVHVKKPGLAVIIPIADRLRKVTMRIITMPIQSQGIITKDNGTVDISAVTYFRVVDDGRPGIPGSRNPAGRGFRSGVGGIQSLGRSS